MVDMISDQDHKLIRQCERMIKLSWHIGKLQADQLMGSSRDTRLEQRCVGIMN